MSVEPKPIRLSSTGKFITVAIIVTLAILLFSAVGSILTPFVAAVITAYLFNPLIGWLHRRTGMGRGAWIGVLYVLIGVLTYALIRWLGPMVGFQYRELVALIPAMRDQVAHFIAANQIIDLGGVTIDLYEFEEPIVGFFTDLGKGLPETVPHLVFSALESLVLFVTYLLVTFYLLLQAEQITNAIYGLVPAPYRAEIRGLGQQVDAILAGYIRGTLLLIPIMATFTYIMLKIFGHSLCTGDCDRQWYSGDHSCDWAVVGGWDRYDGLAASADYAIRLEPRGAGGCRWCELFCAAHGRG